MKGLIVKQIFCLALLLFVAGCATTSVPPVATHYDPYTKVRTDIIPENLLDQDGPAREMVWLNASRVFYNLQDFDYFLEVHYEALAETGLLDISPGESLVIIADDQELKFKGHGSANFRKEKGNLVSEDAVYMAGPDQLGAIARAKAVKVKVIGRNGLVERDFRPENFEKFQKFVAHYVDNEPMK